MSNLRVTAASAICALLGLNPTIAQASPCTADIAQFEAAIRQSAGNPFAGLTARQSVNAELGRQPTPESLHQAKERLKSKFPRGWSVRNGMMLRAIVQAALVRSTQQNKCIFRKVKERGNSDENLPRTGDH